MPRTALPLVVTTQRDNIHDAIRTERVPPISGARHRPARQKFDRAEAIAYRKQGVKFRDIAAYFGVNISSVFRSLRGCNTSGMEV